MAEPSEALSLPVDETPIVNRRRKSLLERHNKRYRNPRTRRGKAGSRRGFASFALGVLRLSVVAALCFVGGPYVYRSYLGPDAPQVAAPKAPRVEKTKAEEARESYSPEPPSVVETVLGDVIERPKDPGPPTIFDTKIPGGETQDQFSKRTLAEINWELAHKMIEPTRQLLDRLEKAEKELPELNAYLRRAERDRVFGEDRFRYGYANRAVSDWARLKDYRFPVSRSDLETWRKKFEAAVGRAKAGMALDEDPATIFKTYEFAGKVMKLELEKGMFVIPRSTTGPEDIVAELKRIKHEVDTP